MWIEVRSLTATALLITPVLAQTQPTRPSEYPTVPTLQSAFRTAALSPCSPHSSFNPTSSCYTGTPYRSYSAIEPLELQGPTKPNFSVGSASLDEDQAKHRIEAKGYSGVSELGKDQHGIWRGKATMKDGRPVAVVVDLEGNVYSIPSEPRARH